MSHRPYHVSSSYVRNFTFGVEDSLASTVGLLSGAAAASVENRTIVITGLILILTEALSMGVGSFLTEQSVQEYEQHKDQPLKKTIPGALIMFFSYTLAGLIPLSPYMYYQMPNALQLSISSSLLGLVSLGVFNSVISKTSLIKQSFRTLVLGGSVAIAGVLIGHFLKNLSF